MFVILSYDIETKRVSKVMRTVKKYLRHCQNSVFDGNITEARLKELMRELETLTEPEKDSIVIYKIPSNKLIRTEEFGAVKRQHNSFL